uniref:Uncharacterized protein n=1 Tax=Romanomermis culicivorax TaxID=13658 RepID=A0A915KLP9_ROMCU
MFDITAGQFTNGAEIGADKFAETRRIVVADSFSKNIKNACFSPKMQKFWRTYVLLFFNVGWFTGRGHGGLRGANNGKIGDDLFRIFCLAGSGFAGDQNRLIFAI